MTRKGVVGPLTVKRGDAAIAAATTLERTEGVDLEGTPFVALPEFGRKISNALKRKLRNPKANEIKLWTVNREEAEAGYTYLMLFSHEDIPPDFLTYEEMDAVNNVALSILDVLIPIKGAQT